ncbi:bcl-2-binding component 3 isoform X3 [Notamacropus eugenii]|uniref:bcl-2-binding component 3 isoform X3 n=1 Tax=Notamacropus eugenii TaxID=9315 RepID=UPI003B679D4D
MPPGVSFSASALAPRCGMARAQQDGSSPEPVEGLPREGPRSFPLGRLMPSAVSCSLCEAGLNPSGDSMCPAPGPTLAPPSLLPLAYFCTRQPRSYGGPRWARVARSPAPGSQGQSGSLPSLGERSAEEQEEGGQEVSEPQGASPMSGGPPGVLGPDHGDQGEQRDREIGAQLRRMADDLNALYEQRELAVPGPCSNTSSLPSLPTETRGGAKTSFLPLEASLQSHLRALGPIPREPDPRD